MITHTIYISHMSYALSISHMRKRCSMIQESAIPIRVGRKKQWSEDMQARFPEGTFARIEAVLKEGEDRTDFVRDAVERELRRRGGRLPESGSSAGRKRTPART
jgi:hypothetical protein